MDTKPEQVELTDEELVRLERESSARLRDLMDQEQMAAINGDAKKLEELLPQIEAEFRTGLQYIRMQIESYKKEYSNEEKETQNE